MSMGKIYRAVTFEQTDFMSAWAELCAKNVSSQQMHSGETSGSW